MTLTDQVMRAYYNRDADALLRLMRAVETKLQSAEPRAAGPSGETSRTGNSNLAAALADGPAKG